MVVFVTAVSCAGGRTGNLREDIRDTVGNRKTTQAMRNRDRFLISFLHAFRDIYLFYNASPKNGDLEQ